MGAAYLDTSVLGRVLLDEPDGAAIRSALGDFEQRVSSRLLAVELHRLGLRTGLQARVAPLLAGIILLPVSEESLLAAETLAPSAVATLDAIHLATAVRLAADDRLDALFTYDRRLAEGAIEHAIEVISPG